MTSPSTYQTTVTAFLDIWGLKEAVQKSLEDPELAKKIEGILLGLQHRCTQLNASPQWGPTIPNLRARAFSDSLVLTCPVDSKDSVMLDDALRRVAVISSAFQMEVTQHGFFIRGAITVGLHCGRGDVFFGPALIEAYEAERQMADWPRVIVLPKALKLRAHGRHPYLRRDDAGVTYVDYLHLCTANVILESRTPENRQAGLHPYSWISLVKKHRTAVETAAQALDADSPQFLTTLSKYYSLAQYHNRYLRQYLRGSKDIPLIGLLELILSGQEGMTNDGMNKEISQIARFFSEKHEEIRGCIIDMRGIFAFLRHGSVISP